jgi:hypothetical protein
MIDKARLCDILNAQAGAHWPAGKREDLKKGPDGNRESRRLNPEDRRQKAEG